MIAHVAFTTFGTGDDAIGTTNDALLSRSGRLVNTNVIETQSAFSGDNIATP